MPACGLPWRGRSAHRAGPRFGVLLGLGGPSAHARVRALEADRAGDEGAGDELSGVSVRIIAEQACSEAIL